MITHDVFWDQVALFCPNLALSENANKISNFKFKYKYLKFYVWDY